MGLFLVRWMNAFEVEIAISVALQSSLLDALNVIVPEDDFDIGGFAGKFGDSAANCNDNLIGFSHFLALRGSQFNR